VGAGYRLPMGTGIAVIVGSLVGLVVVLAVVYTFLIRRTRRERTAQGTHRAGPGRSSPSSD
jgi:protein-S-isoprenylcysteine O-methyltransferase Ste14